MYLSNLSLEHYKTIKVLCKLFNKNNQNANFKYSNDM